MQSDAIAIVTMGMGTPQATPITPGRKGDFRGKAQYLREFFASECTSGC